MFTYVYSCLPMITTVCSSLPKFGNVYSCLFTYACPCLLVFTCDPILENGLIAHAILSYGLSKSTRVYLAKNEFLL